MRILILTQFYPPEVGAAAVRLSRLAQRLAADGHDVTVLTSMPNYPSGVILPPYNGHVFYSDTMHGVPVRRVWVYASPQKRNRVRLLNQISFMMMAALRGTFLARPDVILVESHPLFVCLTGGWLKRVKRAPIVLNVSDLWPESAVATGALREDSLMVRMATRVERWAYRDAAQVVGMTRGVVEGINRVLNRPERVTFIQNAVDLSVFKPGLDTERAAMRDRFGVGDCFVVAHVGNLSLTYDVALMMDAAAALPQIVFLFVGSGAQVGVVETAIRERALENVVMAGVLPHDEMPAVWAAADACLIALRDHSVAGGTIPAKMVEAMASGTPVVAAIRGEGAALLTETGAGTVVPIGDTQAMIDAIGALATSPDTQRTQGSAGRTYAEAHLSPERVQQAYLTLFERAARRSPTAEDTI